MMSNVMRVTGTDATVAGCTPTSVPRLSTPLDLGFDPGDMGFVANPYPAYERLRDQRPIMYDEAIYHWLVTRFDEMLIVAGVNPERIRTEAAWAKLCGVAPIPASSGRRHGTGRIGAVIAKRTPHPTVR